MDIFPLLNEAQAIARNGLRYANNPYDTARYTRLLELVSTYYGQVLDLPAPEVKQKFATELGIITPKVGADAAIFDNDGQILLQLRTDDRRWCLPCGWVEANEAPVDTAVRETKEECGLDVRPLQLVDVFTRLPSVVHGPETMVAVVYLCEVIGGEIQVSHEGLDVRYWKIDEVPAWHKLHRSYAEAAYSLWLAQ